MVLNITGSRHIMTDIGMNRLVRSNLASLESGTVHRPGR